MRLGREGNHGEPASEMGKRADPAELEEDLQLGGDDLGFMDTVTWWATGDGVGVTSVNAELVVENGWATPSATGSSLGLAHGPRHILSD